MAEGVTFYDGGSDDVKNPDYNTVPNEPSMSDGGPVESSEGAQPSSRSFDKTSPSWDNVGPVPKGGSLTSPTDV